MRCTTPKADASSIVWVALLLNGKTVNGPELIFTYTGQEIPNNRNDLLTVTSLSIAHGPVTGGSQVILEGEDFGTEENAHFRCRFGNNEVRATRLRYRLTFL